MSSSAFEQLPDPQAIAHANELASSSSKVMDFLQSQLQKKLSKSRATAAYGQVLQAVDQTKGVADEVTRSRGENAIKCWRGEASAQELARYQPQALNYLDVPAIQEMQALQEILGEEQLSDIVMAYDIDEASQFNRAYVVNDEVLDTVDENDHKILDLIDKMFHSWLVSNGMAADNSGVIYFTDKNGALREKVQRKTIVQLIEDPKRGFHSTVAKIDPNLRLSLMQVPAPGLSEEPEPSVPDIS